MNANVMDIVKKDLKINKTIKFFSKLANDWIEINNEIVRVSAVLPMQNKVHLKIGELRGYTNLDDFRESIK